MFKTYVSVPYRKKIIDLQCRSDNNRTREKQVHLLMITDKHKWHYVTIKSISDLFRDITGKNNGDYYCLNCFHWYRTEDKLKEHELICTNHDYCNLISPDENNKILQYKQGSYMLKMAMIFI